MERIGMIASKISSGNLFLYNCYVIVISFLLSFLVFLLAGCAIFLGLWVLRLSIGPFIPSMSSGVWNLVFCYSLSALTVLVGMINLVAVLKNIKLRK